MHDGVAEQNVQNLGRNPQTFVPFRSTLRFGASSQVTPLWASLWLSKDHEEIKRVALTKS